MNKKVLVNILCLSGSILITSVTSFFVGRVTAIPKKTAGSLYIQHREDGNVPDLYLGDVDPQLLNDRRGQYAVVKLIHVRK